MDKTKKIVDYDGWSADMPSCCSTHSGKTVLTLHHHLLLFHYYKTVLTLHHLLHHHQNHHENEEEEEDNDEKKEEENEDNNDIMAQSVSFFSLHSYDINEAFLMFF